VEHMIYLSCFHNNEYLQDITKIKSLLKVLWWLLYLSDMHRVRGEI